jgi:hypothetical protein
MANFNSMSQTAGSTQSSAGVAVFCKAAIVLPNAVSESASLLEDSDTLVDPAVETEQNFGAVALGAITLCALCYFLRARQNVQKEEKVQTDDKAHSTTTEATQQAKTNASTVSGPTVVSKAVSKASESPYPPDDVVYYDGNQTWAYFKQLPHLFQAGTINAQTTVWVDNERFGGEWLELVQFVEPWHLQGSTFHHHESSPGHLAPPPLPPVPRSEEAIP